jgi:hypothetical protein
MGDDLIAAVPWLVFAAGLAAIGLRLLAGRRSHGRPAAGPPAAGPPPADPARQPGSTEKAPRAPRA